uniref:peptidylprolyl isomerase n=1 Tax=Pyrodinium bahamense TaxID=73915 RepID=A0A7S0A4P7_9DINO|mmetsp:Transcript_22187/g.61458  ORF Transcript_22187/g.61458 Transcript_22187/m.61458 type:complete len:791 (+) Transcript_22187:64-2436(+)
MLRDAVSGDGQESDAASTVSEPPDWNSDDEPPEDHVGDEQICSRDGMVTKKILSLGHGLGRPGQYDRVHARYLTLHGRTTGEEADATLAKPTGHDVSEGAVLQDVVVQMGEDQLPLAVEFALKCMKLGETAEVVGPLAYAARSSPLCGQRLRHDAGRLPSLGKVSRKLRFLPVAPHELAAQARRDRAANITDDGALGYLFRARVELLAIDSIQMLTEDRSVSKQLVRPGRGRRTPRLGDLVTFSVSESGSQSHDARHTLVLGDCRLPFEGMERVLLSMKEGEQCLARLPRPVDEAADLAPSSKVEVPPGSTAEAASFGFGMLRSAREGSSGGCCLSLTLHCWRRRDTVPVPPPGSEDSLDLGAGAGISVEGPVLRKLELCAGPERLAHDLEHGSGVLVGLARCVEPGGFFGAAAAAVGRTLLLSWRLGEGSVPGYLEAALAGMRLAESAAFLAPQEAVELVRTGPPYEGQTPLRRLVAPELSAMVEALFDDSKLGEDADAGRECGAWSLALHESRLPTGWANMGDLVKWEDLDFEQPAGDTGGLSFKLTLLAATEAPDVCLMSDEAQREYLDTERAHGNSLAKVGRFAEASLAYSKALDAVRRTPLYKELFPTERGRIQGAYTRDPGEHECPLERLPPVDVDAWRASLIALHQNLALCAAREDKPAVARRHATAVLGADPMNSRALFRRGSAAATQGDFEDALRDLQRAAELEPRDRAVREELQALRGRMRQHREAERGLFRGAFGPPARGGGPGGEPVRRSGEAPPDAPPVAPAGVLSRVTGQGFERDS